MEERVQVDDGFNLVDLIKILLNKIKILILVVVCGGIAGAAFAVWRTVNINYYGTTVKFYINPESRDSVDGTENANVNGIYGSYSEAVMNTAIGLLNSDFFTEWLILNGNALPEKGVWVSEGEETLGLDALIDEAQAAIDEAEAKRAVYETKRTAAEASLQILQQKWKAYVATTKYANFAYSLANFEKAVNDLAMDDPSVELVDAYNDYEGETGKKQQAIDAQKATTDAMVIAEEKKASVFLVWEKTAKYKSASNKYSNAVSFAIVENTNASGSSTALSFIQVSVSVLNDEAFAKELLSSIKTVVPAFVEAKMKPPSGYTNINCQRITRNDEVTMTNPGYTRKQAIIYGLAGAAFAGLAACVIVILLDRSNKCLRNYEIIPKSFNVPILGVIPTIEDMLPTGDKNEEVQL